MKTRIKLIYRPAAVKDSLEDAAKTLTWKRVGNSLQVTNPSAHYITFFNVKINGTAVKEATMVAPQSSATFAVPALNGGALSWQFINDYGGTSKPLVATL